MDCGHGEGKGGMNWESSVDVYTLSNSEKLLDSTEPSLALCDDLCDDLEGQGGVGECEGGSRGRGYTYTVMTDWYYCMAETNTTL